MFFFSGDDVEHCRHLAVNVQLYNVGLLCTSVERHLTTTVNPRGAVFSGSCP